MVCIKKEMEYNIAFVKAVIKEHGTLIPMAVGIVGDERIILPFNFRNDDELKVQAEIIKAEVQKQGAEALVIMTEAWTVQLRHPALYNPSVRAKDHPNRQECVVILYITKQDIIRIIIPFRRVLDTIEFGKESRITYKTATDEQWHDTFK